MSPHILLLRGKAPRAAAVAGGKTGKSPGVGSDPFSYKGCLPSPPWASLHVAAELSLFSLESMNFYHSSCHLLCYYIYFTSFFLGAFSTLPDFIYSSLWALEPQRCCSSNKGALGKTSWNV